MSTKTDTQNKQERFLALFAGREFENPAVEKMLNEARFSLRELDLPTRKTEAWKYTPVGKFIKKDWQISPSDQSVDLNPFCTQAEADLLVFVDGFYREDLSDTSDAAEWTVESLGAHSQSDSFTEKFATLAPHGSNIFTALNTAFVTGGVVIHVKRKAEINRPIHLMHLHTQQGAAAFPRHLIDVEESASLNLVMSHHALPGAATFTNLVAEIFLGENANLHVDYFQNAGNDDFLLSNIQIHQLAHSRVHLNTLTENAAWVRNDVGVLVEGTNCETNLYGCYAPAGKQHVDNHTAIDHRLPHCNSNELYKGVLYDKATGVFNGKVFVRQEAQKTNAFQQNANILMSDDATMNSKPELEIYADDVKCSHGSTTGQFDEEAVFYLTARGIEESSARKMLVDAFMDEVLEQVKNPLK